VLQTTRLRREPAFSDTGDHGQNLGHYRLPSCKLNVYEHDVRVPLLVRGPGLVGREGSVIEALSGNTDLAPVK